MAIEFAKATKIINVTSGQTTVFIQDLIDGIRDYEDNVENMELARIANASGKQNLGGGALVGITLELINDWRIAFSGWNGPVAQAVSVAGGNLVATNIFDNVPVSPADSPIIIMLLPKSLWHLFGVLTQPRLLSLVWMPILPPILVVQHSVRRLAKNF